MTATYRVLVADAIALDGLEPLRADSRFDLVVKPGLTGGDLAAAIAAADAVLVRSSTRITRESLAQATHLKAIGRAGVGVDTIDVEAATERGIAVLTAPAGNTISAAELTLALLLALARRVPAADRSMKAGEWDKKSFTGIELYGKTLGLIGAGRIGGEVARRARAFGMHVLVFDPFLNADRARTLDVQLGTLDEVITRADVISLHVPLNDETSNMIGAAEIARMKSGTLLLNVARGGVVNENALCDALRSRKLGGAALDVFEKEPLPADHPLRTLPNVVLTPHLGASTAEAQQHVAVEIAEAVRAALLEGDLSRAVNAPAVGGQEMRRIRPLVELAERLGALAAALAAGALTRLEIRYAGSADSALRVLAASAVSGALARTFEAETVNLVNALHLARARGIAVQQVRDDARSIYREYLEVLAESESGRSRVAGALLGDSHARIVRVDDFHVDLAPRGTLLVLRNRDVPGVIGFVGSVLGRAGINIAEYHQARRDAGGDALALIGVDHAVDDATMGALREVTDIHSVLQVRFDHRRR